MIDIEQFLTNHGGLGAFGALIALKLGEMIWTYFRNRDRVTNETLQKLTCELNRTREAIAVLQEDVKKIKIDLNRAYHVIRGIVGKGWPEISDEIRQVGDNNF